MRGQHAPWALLVISSAFYFLSNNEADNDLWIHLLIGRRILASRTVPRVDDLSYTASGGLWVDHEWLTHVMFAVIYDFAGSSGLLLLKVAVGLLTSWLVYDQVARRSATAWVRGFVMVLTLSVLSRGFAVRPQILTYLAVAWLLGRLQRNADAQYAGRRLRDADPGVGWCEAALITLVFLVWANAHGAFVVGLGILCLRAAVPPLPLRGRRWVLVAVGALAACANPYGPRLLAYVLGELGAPHPLTEWQPVSLADPAQGTFFLLLLLVLGTLVLNRSLAEQPWRGVLLVVVALLSVIHQRHTPLLALCAAAPLAEQIEVATRSLRRRGLTLSAPTLRGLSLGLILVAGAQVWLTATRLQAAGLRLVFEAHDYPVGAVRFLRENGTRGNVALPLDWGGYVLWHTAPEIKVSLDGRFVTVYPPHVVQTNFDFFRGGETASRLLEEYPTTHVLAPLGSVTPARLGAGWRLLYRDEVAELYARAAPGEIRVGKAPRGRLRFP